MIAVKKKFFNKVRIVESGDSDIISVTTEDSLTANAPESPLELTSIKRSTTCMLREMILVPDFLILKNKPNDCFLSSNTANGDDCKSQMLTGLTLHLFDQQGNYKRQFAIQRTVVCYPGLLKTYHLIWSIDYFWKCVELMQIKIGFLMKLPDRENILK